MEYQFNYLDSEFRQTCETDDWESIERKDCKLLATKIIPAKWGPSFKYPGFIEDILSKDCEDVANESESDCFEDEIHDHVSIELEDFEEDTKKHWLPSPCFVHHASMDFPTPKQEFSPSKPRKFC